MTLSFNVNDNFRNNVTVKLNTYTKDMKKAKNIEISLFNATLKDATERTIIKKWENPYFVMLYKDHFRSLWVNIRNKDTQLLEKIQSGEIDCRNVGELNHQDMYQENWKELIDAMIERNKHKYENNKEGVSTEFKCGRCKKRETKYTQVQTRSADEPMTTFVTCVNCGNHWKC